ncbi:MAG: DUF554 domain-containing protein [Chloroflexi bacterium]|jgi:uncharacterized membrane protein YqgA involved in biofilm formation|nr:DUF554 domain-containing protein [Chloroflexota bacterium]
MTGTFLNVLTVLVGGTLGLFLGGRLPERIKSTVIAGLGTFTISLGLQMFLKSENALIVLGGLLLGSLLGEWWHVEEGLRNFGAFLEARFARGASSQFIRGFLTTSLLFCIGPMTILGAIQDGLRGDYRLLAVKAVMDGFAALAFASSLGIGVLFSAVTVLIYQGSISLLASQLNALLTSAMINEMTATGGVILIGLALSTLLEIKPIRTGNFLPALLISPLIVWILGLLK